MAHLPALLVATAFLLSIDAATAAPASVNRVTEGNRTSEQIPSIPPELRERLGRYQNTRGAVFGGWLADGSMLITTRFGATWQAHRVRAPLGMREQLTFFDEPVNLALADPGKRNGFAYLKDVGGSEFWQLFWLDMDTRESTLLSNGKRSRNEEPVFSPDGRWLAFSSTERNGTDSDIWVLDTATGKRRNVVTEGGAWYAYDFSPDNRTLLVYRFISINEIQPGKVDLASGKLEMFPVEGGTAAITDFAYDRKGRGAYFVSDENSEFRTLRHHDLATNRITPLSADIPWDVGALALSDDGRYLAFVTNEDGSGQVHVLELPGHRAVALPELPLGVVGAIGFDRSSRRLAITLNSATTPSDIYVLDVEAAKLTRWTESEVGGLDARRFVAPTLVRFPTFDQVDGKPRTIPAFYYRPAGKGPFPVVVNIHGGPESQAFPVFNPHTQYLVNELGIAVLVPNVRGSAGYGKSYLLLDNGLKRKDSVKDIGALLDWIAQQPELDAKRVGVIGGSYGGYMVLATMIDYGERLAAGIELVGISHFRTFLANTEAYRRDLRRAEYGDEREPGMGEFLDGISPLTNAARIHKPLFVAQGANDPRVPVSEAEQIVKAVRASGRDVWYLLYADEGHGFQKKPNIDHFGAASVLFWQKHLLDTAP